jgi:hypothetical protein
MSIAADCRREENMTSKDSRTAHWVDLVRSEYLEMPGLHLTKRQAQRMWGLDAATCETVLDALEDVNFLRRTMQDGYVRSDVGR